MDNLLNKLKSDPIFFIEYAYNIKLTKAQKAFIEWLNNNKQNNKQIKYLKKRS